MERNHNHGRWTRREVLALPACLGPAAAAAAIVSPSPASGAVEGRTDAEPFGHCLNLSTIRGQQLSLPEQIAVAAKAGYRAIEPWIREIQQYAEQGKSLDDLRKRIADLGLTVESAIGFADWISDDDARRAAGLEQWKRELEVVARIGGKRVAASPSGAWKAGVADLAKVPPRYRALLEIGRAAGVVPQVEMWGSAKVLSRIGEVAFVAIEAAHADACILLDAYQIHKGNCDFGSLRLLNGRAMHVFHINDYPADPPRETINDAARVYPGDGVAPMGLLLRTLRDIGFRGFLSLELFNREYWKQDALTAARTGLEKTRRAVRRAMEASSS